MPNAQQPRYRDRLKPAVGATGRTLLAATGLKYAKQPPAETTLRQQESREDVIVENSPQTAFSRAHAVHPGGQRSRRRQSGEGRGPPFAPTGAPPPDAAATAASTLS